MVIMVIMVIIIKKKNLTLLSLSAQPCLPVIAMLVLMWIGQAIIINVRILMMRWWLENIKSLIM